MSIRRAWWWLGAAAGIGAMVSGGCRSAPTPAGGPEAPGAGDRGEPPNYAEIADRYNARVEPFQTVWARTSVRVEGRDAEGGRLSEQGEGHLQIERPDKLALSLGKLGETHLYLGSNPELYWWMDLIESGDHVAIFGRHAQATPDKVEGLGVPVHPLDLIQATAITELPSFSGSVSWGGPGEVIVITGMRWGARAMWLNERTLEPRRVVISNRAGETVLDAKLSRYATAVNNAGANGRIATRYEIRVAGLDAMVRIELFEPRIRSIREIAFDFERLCAAYDVTRRVDLDEEGPGG